MSKSTVVDGTYEDIEAVGKYSEFAAQFEELVYTVENAFGAGEQACVEWSNWGRKHDGAEYRNRGCFVFGSTAI